jgi:hypothetical protein
VPGSQNGRCGASAVTIGSQAIASAGEIGWSIAGSPAWWFAFPHSGLLGIGGADPRIDDLPAVQVHRDRGAQLVVSLLVRLAHDLETCRRAAIDFKHASSPIPCVRAVWR